MAAITRRLLLHSQLLTLLFSPLISFWMNPSPSLHFSSCLFSDYFTTSPDYKWCSSNLFKWYHVSSFSPRSLSLIHTNLFVCLLGLFSMFHSSWFCELLQYGSDQCHSSQHSCVCFRSFCVNSRAMCFLLLSGVLLSHSAT